MTTRKPARQQSRLTRLIIGVSMLAAFIAIAPIAAGILGMGSRTVQPSTAFASAPAGNYAVVSRNEGEVDVLAVVWAENPAAVTEITRVPHLEGFTSTGAVSPDGKLVALVTVDAGSATRPGASLLIANLETGELSRVAISIEPMQMPVWAPDGRHVVVTRTAAPESGGVNLLRVSLDAKEDLVRSYSAVLGAYPIGFDGEGSLISVVIDERGSTVERDGEDVVSLGQHITRDWQLSPDASQLAYIEVSTGGGLQYFARTASLGSTEAMVSRQALETPQRALGAVWNPADGTATYGFEPSGSQAGVAIQSLSTADAPSGGFDIPLAFSADGEALAVTHWTGESFGEPGHSTIEIVGPEGRSAIDGYTGFFGWSQR